MATIAEQNFNSLDSSSTSTTDSLPTGSSLTNAGAQNSGGAGLDFATFWFDTRGETNGPVLASNDSSDFIGVNSFAGSNAPNVSADGTAVAAGSEHNFEFNDSDGRLELVFETIDLSGFENRMFSLNYWIADTGFESDDSFVVSISDGTTSVNLLTLGETELEAQSPGDAGNANEWTALTVDLEQVIADNSLGNTLTLTVSADTNSGSENLFVDDILFEGDAVPTTPVINEFSFNTAGADVEYFEILGAPNIDLSAYTILYIEGDDADIGAVKQAISVGTTDANGFFLANLAANTLTNETSSYLLVEGFTGSVGDDLDDENDGVFDTTPWTRIVDSVAVDFGGTGEVTYGGVVLTSALAPADNTFAPGGASRIPDGTDTDTAADWVRNDFDLAGIPGETGTPDDGEALNTPGAANQAVGTVSGTTLSIDDVSQAEGDAGTTDFVFTVTRSGDTSGTTTVDFATADGTATAGSDYTAASDTLTFTAGETTQTITVSVNGDTDLETDETFTVGLSNASGGATLTDATGQGTIVNDDGITVTRIHDIQGTGTASPLVGTTVTVSAIVTADFQDSADSDYNGFFLQEEDADQDANPLTSEGLFVFEGSNTVAVSVGDLVEVTGEVTEFNGETQLSNITSLNVVGTGTATPATVTFPIASTVTLPSGETSANYEPFEGMLVTIPEELTVGDLFNLGRYNEVGLTSGGRVQNFTQTNAPSVSGFTQFQQDVAARAIVIDDAFNDNSAQNSDPIFPSPGLNADTPTVLRSGDTVENLTGVISFRDPSSFEDEAYRLIPTEDPSFVATNPRDETPPDVGGSLTVASFNVLNFFTSIDTNVGSFNGPNITGPAGDQEPRGAESEDGVFTTDPDGQSEFDRQLDKLLAAISTISADIVGLIEIENDPEGDTAITALTDALNAVPGATYNYQFVDTGPIEGTPGGTPDGDAIKVGFLYDANTVSLDGAFALLDITVDPRFDSTNQRATVAQTFTETASGESVTVAVNHFKSKGSPADDPGDADIGDGQAASNGTRTNAANALVDWLATDPTGTGEEDVLIIGDLNAYLMEDPIQAILDGSDDTRGTADDYLSLVDQDDYSFGFPVGLDTVPQVQTFGTLDYALANNTLNDQIAGTGIWHINADEPSALDYNLNFQSASQQQFLFNDDPFRSSDHDPIIVGLDLQAAGPEVIMGDAGPDRLQGTDADEIFQGMGGTDLIATGGGMDEVDLADTFQNGVRDVTIITDFDTDTDIIGGIGSGDVARAFGAGPRSIVYLSDGDVIVLYGVSDPSAIQYEGDLMM
ncbi:MAG: ExeM/NucH family extracellular endonuclease [Pseudomonadota bacterium]